ncbi:MAG: molybdenum cofactor guanylyltransferase MobA [Rhodobacteraceae bacterium]|nr:molybdenum cofactor guanylyltransferase MobA [Paracoccaceae bacterium]
MTHRPIGIILAGGRATRMGGADKALLDLGGKTLMHHCLARLGPQVCRMAINSNGDPADFAQFGLPVISDSLPGHLGPLAGVLAGMAWAAQQDAGAIVTVAVDTPHFPADLVDRLLAHAGPGGICIAASRSPSGPVRQHPTFGLWPLRLRHDLSHDLAQGTRKLGLWADSQAAATAVFDADPSDPFFNINTPGDLRAAQDRITAG